MKIRQIILVSLPLGVLIASPVASSVTAVIIPTVKHNKQLCKRLKLNQFKFHFDTFVSNSLIAIIISTIVVSAIMKSSAWNTIFWCSTS